MALGFSFWCRSACLHVLDADMREDQSGSGGATSSSSGTQTCCGPFFCNFVACVIISTL